MNYLNIIFSLILLFVFTILYMIVSIIFLHSRFHSFWRNHPVAWTTFLPPQEGIIKAKWIKPPAFPFKHNYKVITTQNIVSYKNEIISLWKLCKKSIDITVFTQKMTWFLLIHNDHIISTLTCLPYEFDTPFHNNLKCQWMDHLCVHPQFRGKHLCTLLLDKAIQINSPSNGNVPIGAFLTEYPLPFSYASKLVRMKCVVNPSWLIDLQFDIKLNHRKVKFLSDLPSKIFENSDVRIQGSATLEPSPSSESRQYMWQTIISHPHQNILNINQIEWIHIEEYTAAKIPILIIHGFSFKDPTAAAIHIHHYIRTHYQYQSKLKLIVTNPFHKYLSDIKICNNNDWKRYDEQFLYFYNYRLNSRKIHIPHTWNIF